MKNIWALFIILAFIFLALMLIIPVPYKEQMIGEKLIDNVSNQTNVIVYKYNIQNILLSKQYFRITLMENHIVKFKKTVEKEQMVELMANIFDTSKRCVETNCDYIVLEGNVYKEDSKICVPIPKNPFTTSYAKVKIVCYNYIKPVYKFILDFGGQISIFIRSNISRCILKVNNKEFYLSPCSKEIETFSEKPIIELIPLSEGIIYELSVKSKLIGGKFYRFFSVEKGRYKIIVALQIGAAEIYLDGMYLGKTDSVFITEKTLDYGTHVLMLKPLEDFVYIKLIKIEKIQ